MLAVAAGATHGQTHKVTPRLYNSPDTGDYVYDIVALDKIEADWTTRKASMSSNLASLAVLSMSFGIAPPPTLHAQAGYPTRMKEVLRRLANLGVLPFAAAGNDGVVSDIDFHEQIACINDSTPGNIRVSSIIRQPIR